MWYKEGFLLLFVTSIWGHWCCIQVVLRTSVGLVLTSSDSFIFECTLKVDEVMTWITTLVGENIFEINLASQKIILGMVL